MFGFRIESPLKELLRLAVSVHPGPAKPHDGVDIVRCDVLSFRVYGPQSVLGVGGFLIGCEPKPFHRFQDVFLDAPAVEVEQAQPCSPLKGKNDVHPHLNLAGDPLL